MWGKLLLQVEISEQHRHRKDSLNQKLNIEGEPTPSIFFCVVYLDTNSFDIRHK